MGLNITVRIRGKKVCPHCGFEICGDITDEIHAAGHVYHELLEQLHYNDDHYGDYIELSKEQAEIAIRYFTFCDKKDIAKAIAYAIVTGGHVEFEADW